MKGHRRPNTLSASLVVALAVTTATAAGQTPDPSALATAQALFEAATQELDARHYDVACPKLEEVIRLVPSGHGARLALGECYEGAGKLASAWGQYSIVEVSAPEKDKRKAAAAKVAALRPKLAELTITLPDSARKLPGLEVRRDGQLLGAAQWGIAVPVDKGEHEIVASATGKRAWKKVVHIEADGQKIDVAIGPFEDEPREDTGSAKPQQGLSQSETPPVPTETPRPAPSKWNPQRIAAVSVGTAGLVGLALGVGFGVAAISRKDDAAGHCYDGNVLCDRVGFEAITVARIWGTASTASFVIGGVALATGVALYVTAPKRTAEQRTTMLVGPAWFGVRRDF